MHICKVDRSGIVARHLHIIWKLMPRDARATIGSEKNFIYWKHIADERTSKAEETQKEVVRIVSHYLLSHNIGTHIDIAAARLSTLLSSTQRKPNYMALPHDNMIDGRWDSTLRDDVRSKEHHTRITSRPFRPSQEFTSFLNGYQDDECVKWQTKPHTRTH